MNLDLLPLGESEISVFADIWLKANANNNFQKAAFGDVDPDAMKRWIGTYFLHRYRAELNLHHLKVVDVEAGNVIAVGAWRFPRNERFEVGKEEERNSMEGMTLPQGVNVNLFQAFVGQMMVMEGSLIDSTCYELVTLATLPQFERRGAGTLVINFGLKEIGRTGAKGNAWVKATFISTKLYERLGWKQVEELKIDLQPYGGEGQEIISFMCR